MKVASSSSGADCSSVEACSTVAVLSETIGLKVSATVDGVFVCFSEVSTVGFESLLVVSLCDASVDTLGGTKVVLEMGDEVCFTLLELALFDEFVEEPKRSDLIFDFMRDRMAIGNSGKVVDIINIKV